MNAQARAVVADLHELADPARRPGMARVGINIDRALGVSVPHLRRLARRHRPNHPLAPDLWQTSVHEARILACMVDDAAQVTPEQMETWVVDFDSWDLCDQVCGNLFEAAPLGMKTARSWTRRPEEFVKRAGFALMAAHVVHDRTSPDGVHTAWFPAIRRGADDERNYVKTAVSWALRSIGKRNLALNVAAIEEAEALLVSKTRSARWIGRDALRELTLAEHQRRLRSKT